MTATQVHRGIEGRTRREAISVAGRMRQEVISLAGRSRREAMGVVAVFTVLLWLCAAAAAAAAISPLPASDYAVRPACGPPAPGQAGCLALQLVPRTAAALAHTHPLGMTRSAPPAALSPREGDFGVRPEDLKSAYFPGEQPGVPASEPSQTIALVDAYDDPHIEADLAIYDKEFGLPACTEADKCFRKINQEGATTPLPPSSGAEAEGWAIETSTDVEAAHSVCQNCRIVLVETRSAYFSDLEKGEAAAARPVADGGVGATEISDSWGGAEEGASVEEDNASAFNRPGIVITAAAGDDGYLDWDAENAAERGFPDYPASSPHVVAVGGTRLTLDAASGTWAGESVWNGDGATGGGCSTVFSTPSWQQRVASWQQLGCGSGASSKRALADVSADGDPYTGMAIYDATGKCEYEEGGKIHTGPWCTIGGTSLASPIVAAIFALAGGAHGVEYPARTLYENEVESLGSRHDVEVGSNGECTKGFEPGGLSGCTSSEEAASSHCSAELICLAGPGYDGPSGVGSPDGIGAFQPRGGEEGRRQVEARQAEAQRKAEAEAQRKAEEDARAREREEAEKRGATSAGGGSAGTGSGSSSAPSGAGTTGSDAGKSGTAVTPAAGAKELIPVLSGLSLTRAAAAALSRLHPAALQLAFVFTLSARAHVRVTLSKQVRVHGRIRWQTLPYALTIAAKKGRDSGRLNGHSALAPGRYRLTLVPSHGLARTLTFPIG